VKSAHFYTLLLLLSACDAETDPAKVSAVALKTSTPVNAPEVRTVAEMAAPPEPGGVGCALEETPIFACNLANGKRIAVCGLGEYIGQYRYGGSKPELVINGADYANVMYSGGGESQIAFENGGYRYIVFSRVVRTNFAAEEPNNPAMSDGVMILRGAKFVGMKLCSNANGLPVQTNSANAIWEDERELFTAETVRADP
jgi:hypothetical protein